jgi:type III secretion protein C
MWPKKLKVTQMVKNMQLIRIIISLLLCTAGSYSEEITALNPTQANNPIAKGQFVYYYHGESLRQALSVFARSNGLRISFASGEEGRLFNKGVIGRFVVSDNAALLNMLAAKYNFEWFMYAGTVYFTSTQIVNRSVNVSSDAFKTIRSNLQQIGLLNDKFGYSELPSENKIVISGPNAYVNLVAAQITNLSVAPDRQQYAVYRLKYANAVNTQLSFNNQTITIPGVVTILQNLANAANGTGSIVTNVGEAIKNTGTNSATKTPANGTTAGNGSSEGVANGSAATSTGAASATAPGAGNSAAPGYFNNNNNNSGSFGSNSSIQADPRTNSVILIGDAAQISMYKNLITKLDTPSVLVQVDVMIIHLNQQALDQMGINWAALLGGGAIGFAGGGGPAAIGRANPGDIFVANMQNFSLEVKALSGNNLAEITSKPSLVTENNLPAILSVSETLYSNMQYGVSNYGQLSNGLQITPHVIFDDTGQKRIRLAIVLDDGAQGDDNTSNGTSIIQSTLTSQAVINDGQSILLAGHSVNSKIKKENKVPGLGDIPGLGWLFKSSSTSLQKSTTLFLISPHILWAPDTYKLSNALTVEGRKVDTSSNNNKIVVTPTGH